MIEDRKILHKTIAGALIVFMVFAALYVASYFARSHYSKYADPPLRPGQGWTTSSEELLGKDCRRFPTDVEATVFRPLVYIESQVRGHEIVVDTWNFDFDPQSESAYRFD
jgi:hypothetical protein